jgi:hypothetical protein
MPWHRRGWRGFTRIPNRSNPPKINGAEEEALAQRPITLTILLAGRASLAQTPPPTVQVDVGPAFGRHGVGIIGYSMPEYPGLLRQVIGTVSAEAIAAIQPFTLLIRIGGSLPIAKLVIGYPRSQSIPERDGLIGLNRLE